MKNNNQKIIKTLSRRSMKNNRMRNFFAMAAVILTTILFSGVFTLTAGMVKRTEYDIMREVGTNSHAGFKDLTREQYEILKKDKRIKEGSYDIFLAIAENPELASRSTELRYTEEKTFDWTMMKLKEGHLPKEKKEIVVDTITLDALKLPYELGVEIPVTYTVNGKTINDMFVLSGYYEGDTLAMASESYFSKEYVEEALSVLSESEWKERCDSGMTVGEGLIQYYVKYANSWDIEKKTLQIIRDSGLGEDKIDYGINWGYASYGISNLDGEPIVILVSIVAIIIAAGYLMIYNIFYLSIVNDIRFYGLLKTVGTTQKQIKRLVKSQADNICLSAIPLGIIAGWLLGNAFMPLILKGGGWSREVSVSELGIAANPLIFVFGACFSFLTVRISCRKPGRIAASISPVEAAKFQEIGKGRKKRAKRKGRGKAKIREGTSRRKKHLSYLYMAAKNHGRNLKKTSIVVLSMSLGLVLLLLVYTLVSGFSTEKYVSSMLGGADLYLSSVSLQVQYRAEDIKDGLDDFDKGMEASGIDGIESTRLYLAYGSMPLSEDVITRYKEAYENGKIRAYDDIDTGLIQATINGEVYGQNELPISVYGWDADVLSEQRITEGSFDAAKYETGDYVVLDAAESDSMGLFNLGPCLFKVGDQVVVNGKEYEVMAFVEIPYRLSRMSYSSNGFPMVLPPAEVAKQMEEVMAYGEIYESDDEEALGRLEGFVSQYAENEDKNIKYYSKQSLNEEFSSLKQMIIVIGTTLCAFIGMIALMNYVNSVATGIISRRKEFAMMKSIGMQRKQLLKMLYWESGIYLLLSCMITFAVASLFSWFGLRSFCEEMTWLSYNYTMMPLVFCLPLLVLVGVGVPYVVYHNDERHSVVELLREE